MKIKKGFELMDVCGAHVIISHGTENINFTKVINLNDSAADVWNAVVDKNFTVDDMVNALLSEYEVDEETARKDCEQLVQQWRDAELLID